MAADDNNFGMSAAIRRAAVLAAVTAAEVELARLRAELADAKLWHRWYVAGAEGLPAPALELGSIVGMAWRSGTLARGRAWADGKAAGRGRR